MTTITLDQTWRYTPKTMIFGTRRDSVLNVTTRPLANGQTLVTFTSPSGAQRWHTFNDARITSRLRMAVRGINPRDEVLMAWPPVPASDRAGL